MLREYFRILQEGSREAGFSQKVPAEDAGEALGKLISGDHDYLAHRSNTAELTPEIRLETTEHGQHPYAVVVTCSDARVPPEHIFNAGIGDLFVIRNAGNLMGEFDLGSVEYAVSHLGAKLVLIMGHTHCGAVEAALEGDADGYIHGIIGEVKAGIGDTADPREAERRNVHHSLSRLHNSKLLSDLHDRGEVEFAGAIYDIKSGTVEFLSL